MESTRRKCRLQLWAYVIMPEHVHVLFWPVEAEYKVSLIRTSLKTPVSNKALRYLRQHAPDFLEQLKDEQPNGDVHYRFWQRGGGYDRNVIEPATLFHLIEYIHNNPVRRGPVQHAPDWTCSSARYHAGERRVPIRMDDLPWLNG